MNVYDIVTNKILERIEQAEKDNEPFYWIKPWNGGAKVPENYINRIPYRGANLIMLDAGEYITYKQLQDYKKKLTPEQAEKIHIKKDAHTVPVFFFTKKIKTDKDGNIVYKKKRTGEEVPEETFIFKYYRAYNREDIEGLPSHYPAEKIEHTKTESMERADEFIKAYAESENLTLDFVEDGSRCYYSPSDHLVRVPKKEGFKTMYDYYSSVFHELVHSTSKGLKRDVGSGFGTEKYCKEELVAQIGSALLLHEFEIIPDTDKEIDNDIAYIKGWAEHLKENKSEIVRASHLAESAAHYFLEKAQEQLMLEKYDCKDEIALRFGENQYLYIREGVNDCFDCVVYDEYFVPVDRCKIERSGSIYNVGLAARDMLRKKNISLKDALEFVDMDDFKECVDSKNKNNQLAELALAR